MIEFKKHTLSNGLRILVHEDKSTQLAAVNILYDVGARDENPEKTGFAHLFEHLMFGGSVNVPNYDSPLQLAGGENNAFTTNDITNYYLTLPVYNIETGFWLESDRMLGLAFTEKSLEVQRNVVIEEFRQRYLNQPYGDVWLLLRPLAYKVHPYMWPTIGKEISHIENATMDDVKSFFYKYYNPNNAIMTVAGNVNTDKILVLAEKWFAGIDNRSEKIQRKLPIEPTQKEKRFLEVKRNVPYDAIYITYHICKRADDEYYVADIISDILSRGDSSRLYIELVKNKQIFSSVDAYISGDIDEGLFIIGGKLVKGIKPQDAEKEILHQLKRICTEKIGERELEKVKNKMEAALIFGEMGILNKAMNLAYYELLGDAEKINFESQKYRNITAEMISNYATEIFTENNSSVLYYLAE
jgi:zinc protease